MDSGRISLAQHILMHAPLDTNLDFQPMSVGDTYIQMPCAIAVPSAFATLVTLGPSLQKALPYKPVLRCRIIPIRPGYTRDCHQLRSDATD
jgi:hypothetical protein